MKKCIAIWRLYDGKTGHDRQSEGLVEALGKFLPLDVCELDMRPITFAPCLWLTRRFPDAERFPDPDLIIGAGRRCQWPMLAARRARGGRLVYLMRPGLPNRLFDLCLVPRHDGLRESTHVLLTEGPLNTVTPSHNHDTASGMLLIGGPSRHYAWNEPGLVDQVQSIVETDKFFHWTIADSRRTPAATSGALSRLSTENLDFVSHRDTAPDWINGKLANAGRVWVTRDSVSMIFEALTAGAAVGLLDAPARRGDRITRLADDLLRRQLVADYAAWKSGRDLLPPVVPLWEARRCAEVISRRWFGDRSAEPR